MLTHSSTIHTHSCSQITLSTVHHQQTLHYTTAMELLTVVVSCELFAAEMSSTPARNVTQQQSPVTTMNTGTGSSTNGN